MRILALSNHPRQAAATRFRVEQFIAPLSERGIEVDLRPFLSEELFTAMYRRGNLAGKAAGIARSLAKRTIDIASVRRYDLLFVQREAMFFGPEIFEWIYRKIGQLPLVLDLDDATYVPYESPTYGKLASALKFFGKTDRLIRSAAVVICGNRFIAEYAGRHCAQTVVIPTVADTDIYRPMQRNNNPPVIGWIGTHSTFASLERIFPVLEKLAERYQFRLKIVGAGRQRIEIAGVQTENLEWRLEREPKDFASLDIGLYPIFPAPHAGKDWIQGKSGFKAIQYMACGVPFVMSPVGIAAEIGTAGETHFNAETPEDWYNSLERLLGDANLRSEMGRRGRQHAMENYTVSRQVEKLEDALRMAKKQ
jgi:glycosyltransferase involved in cell wall biosynthesis